MKASTIGFLLVASLAGCTGSMMTGSDAMHSSIRDAVEEDQTYQTAAHEATTMPAMLGEVDRHDSRLTVILGDMTTHMSSMTHCAAVPGMMNIRDDMRSELDAHIATMRGETVLGDALSEVDRHVGTMGSMLDDMGTMLDSSHCGGW